MSDELQRLASVQTEANATLALCADEAALQQWHTEFLGRKAGKLNGILRALGSLPAAERPLVGARANEIRATLERDYEARAAALRRARLDAAITSGRVDVSLPGRRPGVGRLHPVTQTLRDLLGALTDLGFQVAEGPEVETDYYNFEMLRIPQDLSLIHI